ncbi:uncharacterized protein LOC114541786 [Dendronephthya gigantea]|nr:uncharacterized protein LOC114541786 [Dendronephthya gigantea]
MSKNDNTLNKSIFTKQRTKFNFRKSVFFYNSLIVCLGSNINAVNSEPRRTQTTLFQDKYLFNRSVISINGKFHSLGKDFTQELNGSAAILDSNENGYYIPKDMSANVGIRRQHSKTSDGKTRTSARYGTVWLDHGVNPVSANYEYAILVATDLANIEALRKAQASDSPVYKVLHKSSRAHVVRFEENTAVPGLTYGYVFYDPKNLQLIEGPVESVSAECVVMAQIDAPNFSNMNLSLSSPDLNYNTTKKLRDSSDNGINEYFYMRSQPVNITVYLTRSVVSHRVLVNGKTLPESSFNHYVTVKPGDLQHPTVGGREVVFKNLINGESVEVHLTAVEKDYPLN